MHFLFSFTKSSQPNFYLRSPDSFAKCIFKILIKTQLQCVAVELSCPNEQKSHGPGKVLLTSGLTGKPIKVGHSNALKTRPRAISTFVRIRSRIFRGNNCLFVELSWRTFVNHGVLLGFELLHCKAQRNWGVFRSFKLFIMDANSMHSEIWMHSLFMFPRTTKLKYFRDQIVTPPSRSIDGSVFAFFINSYVPLPNQYLWLKALFH